MASRTCSRAMPMTSSASATSSAVRCRLRWADVSMPQPAMASTPSGEAGRPSPRRPAEWMWTSTPASSACQRRNPSAMGVRHTFPVQMRRTVDHRSLRADGRWPTHGGPVASPAVSLDPRTPVLVGGGQLVRRAGTAVGAPEPVDMMADVVRLASQDSQARGRPAGPHRLGPGHRHHLLEVRECPRSCWPPSSAPPLGNWSPRLWGATARRCW